MGAIKDLVTRGNENLAKLIPGQNPAIDGKVKDFQESIAEAKIASLNIAEAQAANNLEKKYIDAFISILQTWTR
jgi:hypothetical protein